MFWQYFIPKCEISQTRINFFWQYYSFLSHFEGVGLKIDPSIFKSKHRPWYFITEIHVEIAKSYTFHRISSKFHTKWFVLKCSSGIMRIMWEKRSLIFIKWHEISIQIFIPLKLFGNIKGQQMQSSWNESLPNLFLGLWMVTEIQYLVWFHTQVDCQGKFKRLLKYTFRISNSSRYWELTAHSFLSIWERRRTSIVLLSESQFKMRSMESSGRVSRLKT